MSPLFGRKRAKEDPDAIAARLYAEAVARHREPEASHDTVIKWLIAEGLPIPLAVSTSEAAQETAHSALIATADLPATARLPLNYFWILGLTPQATSEEVGKAFRRKSHLMHPDRHSQSLNIRDFEDAMLILTDARAVLTDPERRRYYWLHIVREGKDLPPGEAGERRRDWETRARWRMAELGHLEAGVEACMVMVREACRQRTALQGAVDQAMSALRNFEGEVASLRVALADAPSGYTRLGGAVRAELGRKDKLIRGHRDVFDMLPAASPAELEVAVDGALEQLKTSRREHDRFDLTSMEGYA